MRRGLLIPLKSFLTWAGLCAGPFSWENLAMWYAFQCAVSIAVASWLHTVDPSIPQSSIAIFGMVVAPMATWAVLAAFLLAVRVFAPRSYDRIAADIGVDRRPLITLQKSR